MSSATPEIFDVIIIGAGLSGLQTATDLQAKGLRIKVLEAKNRVGGKTYSVSNGRGGTVDVGAAWINDTTQRRMYALSQKFDIEVIKQRSEGRDVEQQSDGSVDMVPFGELKLDDDEKKELKTFFEAIDGLGEKLDPEDPSTFIRAAELDGISLHDYCVRDLPGNVAVLMANGCSRGFLGVEASEISALFFIDYVRSGFRLEPLLSDLKGGAQYLRARTGWQTISQRLAADLHPGTIHLSTPITSISQTSSTCTVFSASTDSTFTSKRVVISVPTPLYKYITFDPPLPEAKTSIAESTHLGFTAKMILIYESAWWRDLNLSGVLTSSIGPLAFTRDSSVEADSQFSLTCFLVGDPGRRWATIATSAERKIAFLKHVDTLLAPAIAESSLDGIPQPVDTIEQIWMNEEWIWGCPCPVLAMGSLAAGAAKTRRESVGLWHFVGTETSVEYQGYMEGAVSSGERGAAEVISALSP